MLRKIEVFFNRILNEGENKKLDAGEVEIASAALLAHCAKADGEQTPEETAQLKAVLGERFDLTPTEIDSVIEAAEARERDAIDLHQFTRVLHQSLDREARIHMVQLLWEIADADGRIDSDERRMVSLTAQLLDVEVHDAVAARHAAQAKKRDDAEGTAFSAKG
jgi:uncharacterized tellurite resistance protein B-like protein